MASLNPQAFPEELFEYYSIPAYQEACTPVHVKGATILSQKQVVKNGAVLFGKLNPRVEKVWLVQSTNDCRKIASTEWLPIYPDPSVADVRFLYLLMWSKHVMPKAQALVAGSTPSRERVDPASFYQIEVPLPPLPEQRKIAAVLWKVQRAVEAEEAIVRSARDLKKSLLRHLFTHGLRGESLKATEIGPIPESWQVVTMSSKCEIRSSAMSYGELLAAEESEDGVLVHGVKVSDMNEPGNKIRFNSANLVKQIPSPVARKRTIVAGAVVFPKRGAAIATNKKRLTSSWTVLDPNLIAIIPGPEVESEFLLNWFSTLDLATITEPGPTPQLNKKNVAPLLFPKPSIPEQQEIAGILRTADAKIALHEAKKRLLQDLFKTLLCQLMTAQVRVNELDIEMNGAEART